LKQRLHPAPGLVCLHSVIDRRIDRAPAMLRGINLDLGGAASGGGGSASLSAGAFSSSFCAMAKRNEACVLAISLLGLSSASPTSPPPWNDAAAPTRAGTAAAVRTV
jgi:hypothetical protein